MLIETMLIKGGLALWKGAKTKAIIGHSLATNGLITTTIIAGKVCVMVGGIALAMEYYDDLKKAVKHLQNGDTGKAVKKMAQVMAGVYSISHAHTLRDIVYDCAQQQGLSVQSASRIAGDAYGLFSTIKKASKDY